MTSEELRECDTCKQEKYVRAFVGSRDICRLCWLDMTKDEKDTYILVCRKRMSYYYNKISWEKEKLARQKIQT